MANLQSSNSGSEFSHISAAVGEDEGNIGVNPKWLAARTIIGRQGEYHWIALSFFSALNLCIEADCSFRSWPQGALKALEASD
jgi:hypothetical protein